MRARLQAGIHPAEAEDLRKYVGGIVKRVEELCSRHDTKPTELPLPSRRAYKFLKELEATKLPSSKRNGPPPGISGLRIPNVVKNAGLFSKGMWDGLTTLLKSADARGRLESEMLAFVSGIETICNQNQSTPSSLRAPSRRAYCWMKFLLKDDNLWLHLNALDRGKQALENSAPNRVGLHMANMYSIWRRRTQGKLVLLKLNEGFIYAEDGVWQALIKGSVSKGDNKVRHKVNEYIESEAFSGVLFEMEAFTRPAYESTVGRVFDLDKIFNRVNAAYFAGSLDKPQLCWNNVITSRKFGHYESARDTVMLSISLDDPAVSKQLVDYVMYHELLHKKHGVRLSIGANLSLVADGCPRP